MLDVIPVVVPYVPRIMCPIVPDTPVPVNELYEYDGFIGVVKFPSMDKLPMTSTKVPTLPRLSRLVLVVPTFKGTTLAVSTLVVAMPPVLVVNPVTVKAPLIVAGVPAAFPMVI